MWRHPTRLALLCAAYFAAGKIGLALAFVNESASAVWPPAGIAVGSLLVFGPGVWPAITLGAFLVNLTTSGLVVPSITIGIGNTLEALAAWWLVTRWAAGPAVFATSRTVFRFAFFAGAVAPVLAATVGTASLHFAGLAPQQDLVSVWITWWLGDAVGVVLVAPLIVLWSYPRSAVWRQRRTIEAAVMVVLVSAASWVVFGNSPAGIRNYPLQFAAAPILLWPAFRLGLRQTSVAIALLSVIAIAGTLQGYGPFARASRNESLLFLEAFVGIFAVLMLAVAAEVETRAAVEFELRALNETQQAARREAEDANRAKDDFLAMVSHELRTPLNAALGWVHILQELPADPQRSSRGLQSMRRNLLAQARLVSDLMDISSVGSGTLPVRRELFDLAKVTREAVTMACDAAPGQLVDVRVEVPPEGLSVIGDAGRLEQVICNLVSNAMKFSCEGGAVDVRLSQEKDEVRLVVEDTGAGIPEEFLPHLFERFRQADSSTTRGYGGLGLGLAITRHIVEAHGGSITAENRKMGGAVFTVRLPST